MTHTHRPEEITGDATGGVIPYKNVPALVSYYLGVFSIIPCFAIPLGLAAVILGIIGLVKYKKQPQRRGLVHALVGLILGGLMFLLNLAVIVLMIIAAIASADMPR